MILSFHPCYIADKNRLCAGRDPDKNDVSLMKSADAVILPQGCRKSLFDSARANCSRVFPDYNARFEWPEKTGQIKMFRQFNAPHPKTAVFDGFGDYPDPFLTGGKPDGFDFPLVFKYNGPGEGSGVWLADNPEQLGLLLEKSSVWEKSGPRGFLIQEYVETGGMCLRVAVVGEKFVSYWRMQKDPEQFQAAISYGAIIDHDSYPVLQEEGVKQVRLLCGKTGINLAGFDLIFPAASGAQNPLFLEVNYYFGRHGLGGSEAFYGLLCKEINKWLRKSLQ